MPDTPVNYCEQRLKKDHRNCKVCDTYAAHYKTWQAYTQALREQSWELHH